MTGEGKRVIAKVSVIVVAHNEEAYIRSCLSAVLGQSHSSFELIVIDDCSQDNTESIVKSFKDDRIIYVRNEKRQGIAFSRNLGIQTATTEHIFFTDADCMPIKYWLQEGVSGFQEKDCLGVEGRTSYETAWTSLADRIIENRNGGAYNTCNIGYKKSALKEAGYFNENYKLVSEDTAMARKVLEKGAIAFLPSMIVFHMQKKLTVNQCKEDVLRVFSKIRYIKDTRDYRACYGKVLYPAHLLYIVFPPLLLLRYRFKDFREVLLLFVLYISFIIERVFIWAGAAKERIFLI